LTPFRSHLLLLVRNRRQNDDWSDLQQRVLVQENLLDPGIVSRLPLSTTCTGRQIDVSVPFAFVPCESANLLIEKKKEKIIIIIIMKG
jgi:hypothetical protein